MGVTAPRPLAAEDDRSRFDCGRASMNDWFRRHAWRNQEDGISRTNVISDIETGQIAGYVTLCAAEIERAWLSKPDQRNRPAAFPAILLGQLAVDTRYQGRGHARSLLLFALATALRLSTELACYAVITHPLDDSVRAFYRRFGFTDTPFDPRRSMIVRIVDLVASTKND
jgi:GNAT superfamily N-acetyltransferase